MSTQCLVVLSRDSVLTWKINGENERCSRGDWSDLALALASEPSIAVTAVMLPDLFSLHQVDFINAERKMLAKTVPFSLEDELADDIDLCHFAMGEPRKGIQVDGEVDVVVVNKAELASLLSRAKEAGVIVSSIRTCPVSVLAQTHVVQVNEHDVAVFSNGGSTVVEQRQLATLLAVLDHGDDSGDQEAKVQLLCPCIEPWSAWGESLANTTFIDDVSASEQDGIELLQGEFKRGLPWRAIWQMWRAPAIAALVLIVVMIGQAWWQVDQLEARNLEYRQAIEATYRKAFPNGRVVNPRRQMETKLAELGAGDSQAGSHLLALMSSLSQEAEASSLEMSGLSYEARAMELRIDILASNFQQVEKLRSALQLRGIQAELQNSSASGSKVRAKLILKEIGS